MLFIHLESAERASWVRLGTDGAVQASGQGPLTGIETGGERVVVLVPGEDVLLTRAEVPGQKRRLLAQAVPYALEEQLIDDVEEQHFALGEVSGSQVNVAVVSHAKMQQWQEQLQQAGIEADQIVPDILALPLAENSWTLLSTAQRLLLRTGSQSGMAFDVESTALALPGMLADAGEARPTTIKHYNAGSSALPELEVELVEEPVSGSPLALLATSYQQAQAINLLQGPYSRRERISKYWRPWQVAAALLAGLVVVQFIGGIVERQQLAAQKESLQAEIEQVYRQAFPEARKVVNAKVQMERALSSLRGGGSGAGGGFADMLAQAGEQFKQTKGLNLQRLSFKDGQLDVSLSIGDLQQLDQLKQQLVEKARLQVEIQSATAKGDQVEARLRIKGAAS